MTLLGYQIPNFTYPGVASDGLFAAVRQQAVEAEASGFDTVLVMVHFYQLAGLGRPEQEMIECYTLLSALAQHTSHVRLSALVTGNTYRHPSLLAKTVTALDVVSGGRAQLGIGTGWFELEHQSLGFEFGTFTDRFSKDAARAALHWPTNSFRKARRPQRHATGPRNRPPPSRNFCGRPTARFEVCVLIFTRKRNSRIRSNGGSSRTASSASSPMS